MVFSAFVDRSAFLSFQFSFTPFEEIVPHSLPYRKFNTVRQFIIILIVSEPESHVRNNNSSLYLLTLQKTEDDSLKEDGGS